MKFTCIKLSFFVSTLTHGKMYEHLGGIGVETHSLGKVTSGLECCFSVPVQKVGDLGKYLPL